MTQVPDGFPLTKEAQSRRVWACPKGDAECAYNALCASCQGRRNRRQGMRKQRAARKALGVPTARYGGKNGNEENWRHPLFADEVKSGAQVGPIATRFELCEKQVEQNRAVGDARPVRITAMPTGWGSDGIVMVRLSVWDGVIEPALRAGYGYGEE